MGGGRDGEKRDGRDPGARTSVGACPEKGLSMKILRAHSADCCARVMAINVTCALARSTMDGGGAVGKGVWGSERSTFSLHLPGPSHCYRRSSINLPGPSHCYVPS